MADEISSGKGTVGHLAKQLHLSNYLGGKSTGSLAQDVATGALGAGELVLSAVTDFLIVMVLTIYLLAALPAIKNFFSHFVPESRRIRFVVLSDEVLAGVGGFLLGNLFTLLVAGLGTFVWATVLASLTHTAGLDGGFLRRYQWWARPSLGSSEPGGIGCLLAGRYLHRGVLYCLPLCRGLSVGQRVMRHAVNVPPVVTVLAIIIGGALLGIIGALVAIPIAAGIKLVLKQTVFPRFDNSLGPEAAITFGFLGPGRCRYAARVRWRPRRVHGLDHDDHPA